MSIFSASFSGTIQMILTMKNHTNATIGNQNARIVDKTFTTTDIFPFMSDPIAFLISEFLPCNEIADCISTV